MAINATWPSCGASAEYPARKNPTIREKNERPFILILPWQVVFAVVSRSFRLAQQLSPSRAGRGSLVGTSRTMRDFRLLRIVLTSNSPSVPDQDALEASPQSVDSSGRFALANLSGKRSLSRDCHPSEL
jgi:hypothetical protein